MVFSPPALPPGLCASCRHADRVPARGGAVYIRCARSRTDPRYPRYPKLPVTACPGYEPASGRPER